MKCERARKMLADYVNEALDTEGNREIQEHVARCEACRRELSALGKILELIDNVKVEYPPTSVWENFLPDLHKRIANEAALIFKKQQRQHLYLLPGWAAVAAIVLIIAASAMLDNRSAIEPIHIQRASNTEIRQNASLSKTESGSEYALIAGIISELLITEAEAEKLKELRNAIQPETLVFPYGYNYDDADVLIDMSEDTSAAPGYKEIIKYLEDEFAELDEDPMMESDDSEFGAI